jgi:hypothetical protein
LYWQDIGPAMVINSVSRPVRQIKAAVKRLYRGLFRLPAGRRLGYPRPALCKGAATAHSAMATAESGALALQKLEIATQISQET